MRSTTMMGTAVVLVFSLAQVQAQTNPNDPAAVPSPAPAGVAAQGFVPPANSPAGNIPNANPIPNNGFDKKPNTDGAIVVPNAAAGAAIGTQGMSDEVRARYQWQNGQWRYQMEDGSWMYYTNGQWVAIQPDTNSVAPTAVPQVNAPQSGNCNSANSAGSYTGNNNASPGYGYYQGGTGYGSPSYGSRYYSNQRFGLGTPGYGYRSGFWR